MNRFIIRATKYLIYFCVLLIIMFLIMGAINNNISHFSELYFNSRGLSLLAIIIVFSLTYPFIGFTKKTLTFDASKKVDDVERVMTMCGYKRIGGTNDAMVFRGVSTMKRLQNMWEDEITITTIDELSTITGPRKEIVKANLRFGTFI